MKKKTTLTVVYTFLREQNIIDAIEALVVYTLAFMSIQSYIFKVQI